MWLPEEERKLLTVYYLAIRESLKKVDSTPTAEKWYSVSDLVNILEAKDFKEAARELKDDYHKSVEATYEETGETSKSQYEEKDRVKDMKQFLATKAVLDAANAALAERNLIKLRHHDTQLRKGVSLTIDGYDLGRKYSRWFTRTGLRFAEYRNHWIWLIVSFFGGVIGAVIVQLIVARLKSGQ